MTKYGSDFLGGAFFVDEAIKGSTKGDVFGIMPETFKGKKKNGWIAVEAFLKSKKFSEGVVHITPFDRSHKYPIESLKPLLKKNALKLEALSKKYPNTQLLLSPFCEHTHSRQNMDQLFRWLRSYTSLPFVNSIIGAGQTVPGIITEIHIESSKTLPKIPTGEYVVSFDGFGGNPKHPGDFADADIPSILIKYMTARHIRAWDARYNGKYSPLPPKPNEPPVPEPNKRTFWPSVEYIKGKRATLRQREGNVTYPPSILFKTFADDHGAKPPTKDNKALVIIPNGGENEATVFDSKGNKIDSMKRYKPDHTNDPKGRRYYSKLYAYQIADKAVKNTGSSLITIKSGSVTLPLTDGYLRSGKFK